MAKIDEGELFDVEIDEAAEMSVDRLSDVAHAKTDEMNKASEKHEDERQKSKPDEGVLEKLWGAFASARAAVEEAQADWQRWLDMKEVEDRLGAEHGKRLAELERSMPHATRADRIARMQEWARHLPTRVILENRKNLGKGTAADDARHVYDEELRRRFPQPAPAPRPTQPRTHGSSVPRRVSAAMKEPLAQYRRHRLAARRMDGPTLMASYLQLAEATKTEEVVERAALRNEWRFRARATEKD